MTGEAPHSFHELIADVLYGGLDPSVPGVGGPTPRRTLQSLACGKARVLAKHPKVESFLLFSCVFSTLGG